MPPVLWEDAFPVSFSTDVFIKSAADVLARLVSCMAMRGGQCERSATAVALSFANGRKRVLSISLALKNGFCIPVPDIRRIILCRPIVEYGVSHLFSLFFFFFFFQQGKR